METRSGSIFIRWNESPFETGHVVEGHTHNFDHTTFFSSGRWRVTCQAQIFKENGSPALDESGAPLWHEVRNVTLLGGAPGSFLLIEANKRHRLECLEGPGVYACIYSHRTSEGDVTPEYTGWPEAYR